jgi:hypothetical protein
MLVYETEKISQRKAAIIIGISLLIMVVCAGFAYGFVHSRLIVNGDADATMNHLMKSLSLFRAEIFCWLIILILDIIIAWALYIFLKQIDNSLALLGAWLRVVYGVILGIAISNLIFVTILLNGDTYLALIQRDQLKVQLMFYLNGFSKIWSFGLILFGFHLLVLAFLVLKSDFIPKFLGILLLIASLSYILVHSLHLFLPQYESTTVIIANILSLPMTIGELGLGLWLLFKGGKSPKATR